MFDISEYFIGQNKNSDERGGKQLAPPVQQMRPRTQFPPGIDLQRTPGEQAEAAGPYRGPGRVRDDLTVAWRWYHPKHKFVFLITAGWFSFLFIWYLAAGFKGDIFMMVFPTLHAVAGLILLYVSVALYKNQTRVSLRGESITVRHWPLPWPGNKHVPARAIEQLFCKGSIAYKINDEPIMTYAVYARLHGGGSIDLVGRLNEAQQALYIEQQLEDCLGIVDIAVPGEMKYRGPKPGK